MNITMWGHCILGWYVAVRVFFLLSGVMSHPVFRDPLGADVRFTRSGISGSRYIECICVARMNAWLACGFALAWNVLHKRRGWIDLRIQLAGTFDRQLLLGSRSRVFGTIYAAFGL